MTEEIVAWICVEDYEVTGSKGLADNWSFHGNAVVAFTNQDLSKYEEALAVQRVYAAALPSLSPGDMRNLEVALIRLCENRRMPMYFCGQRSKFVIDLL